jgi:hypothetical protein
VTVVEPRATSAVPAGRGRWRVELHGRTYVQTQTYRTVIAELTDARGRRLDQAWDSSATFTFTLDGHSPGAALITELTQDVICYRWDEQTGADRMVFRGPITQAEDQLNEDSHTVTFTCHDYLAMLDRRITTSAITRTATDQDTLVSTLVSVATQTFASSGAALSPGSFLPITVAALNPDGTTRGPSGQLRDRTWPASTVIGPAIDDLSKVINGFDYDMTPGAIGLDSLRVWYPNQGVARPDVPLMYGSNVATVTRSATSSDYTNYWRILGNNGSSDPAAAQLYSEAWNSDATNGAAGAVGLWMNSDNAADVTIQSTLDQRVQGGLALSGVLIPTYTLGLAPDAYTWGNPNMGDTVPLIILSGRLNVNTNVRVMGISYDIGDDGQEDVILTVGRPAQSFIDMLTRADRDVDALTRR